MKAEVVLEKKYRGYDLIVRKLSYEPWEITEYLLLMNDHWYCGYVIIPEDSPFYGMDYMDLEDDISVHGGLTFSGEIDDVEGYLLSFDCNHCYDNPYIQNEEYTLKECENLVDQLIEIKEMRR